MRFSLYENTTNNLLEMLEDGKLDILILPLTKAMSQYTVEHLFDEPLYLAMSEEHPLNKKKSLEVSDLQDQTILTLGNSHCLKEQTLSFCLPNGAIEDTSFQATSLETLRYMVAANRGITFIPALAAMQGEVPVEYRQFSDLTPCREVVIVTRKHHHQHVLIQSISEIIRSKVDFSE